MADLLQQIESGALAPMYYLCGERFQRGRALEAIKRAVLGDTDAGAFNHDALEAKGAGADGILAAARTLPMLGERRLVVVRDAHDLNAEQLNRLLPYVEDPSPRSVVVMVADKADLRIKFFTRLRKSGVVQRFEPLKDRDAPRWVTDEARRRQVRLQPGAAQRIAEAVGADMAQLADALERLSLYAGAGEPIRIADVEELLAQTRQRSIFELTNAVGQGNRREAMLVLHQMLQGREPALRIVAMLARHVRQLWSVKELSTTGSDNKEIAAKVGMHPYFVADMVRQAQRFDRAALRRTHQSLHQLDRDLKRSRLSDAALLDQTVLRLCEAG